mmetsp:Transcript_7767/g.22761  ORF Transcript_7767/g.22761 Transcript_7767/m.22761 type:complete len:232 (+) Transcript_7767:1068-1763(+)
MPRFFVNSRLNTTQLTVVRHHAYFSSGYQFAIVEKVSSTGSLRQRKGSLVLFAHSIAFRSSFESFRSFFICSQTNSCSGRAAFKHLFEQHEMFLHNPRLIKLFIYFFFCFSAPRANVVRLDRGLLHRCSWVCTIPPFGCLHTSVHLSSFSWISLCGPDSQLLWRPLLVRRLAMLPCPMRRNFCIIVSFGASARIPSSIACCRSFPFAMIPYRLGNFFFWLSANTCFRHGLY